MKRFNTLFVPGRTKVKIEGVDGWRLVTYIHPTRQWVKVEGIAGSFQRGHVKQYSNKD